MDNITLLERGTDSDVELVHNGYSYECVGCAICGMHHTISPEKMARHLKEHAKKGDKVPIKIINYLTVTWS